MLFTHLITIQIILIRLDFYLYVRSTGFVEINIFSISNVSVNTYIHLLQHICKREMIIEFPYLNKFDFHFLKMKRKTWTISKRNF